MGDICSKWKIIGWAHCHIEIMICGWLICNWSLTNVNWQSINPFIKYWNGLAGEIEILISLHWNEYSHVNSWYYSGSDIDEHDNDFFSKMNILRKFSKYWTRIQYNINSLSHRIWINQYKWEIVRHVRFLPFLNSSKNAPRLCIF